MQWESAKDDSMAETDWAELGARNSNQSSPMVGRNSVTWGITCVSFSKELELGAATENRILEISLMWDVSVLTDVNYRANDLFLWPPHSTPLVVLLVYTLPLSIQQGSTWPQRQQELGWLLVWHWGWCQPLYTHLNSHNHRMSCDEVLEMKEWICQEALRCI